LVFVLFHSYAHEDGQIAFAKYAWEARAIMETASAEQKNSFVEEYLKLFDEIENDEATTMTDLQSTNPLGDSRFYPLPIRHWQYWITLDNFLKVCNVPNPRSDVSYR
jgi:hypothetical protein